MTERMIKNDMLKIKPSLMGNVLLISGRDLEIYPIWNKSEMKSKLGYMKWLDKNGANLEEKKLCASHYDLARKNCIAVGLSVENYPKNLNKYLTN